MSSSSLERLVTHDFRLNILCCLADGAELTAPQLGGRIGKPETAVSYHVKLLESGDLVESVDDGEGNAALYTATLAKHPEWVANAVRDHQQTGGR